MKLIDIILAIALGCAGSYLANQLPNLRENWLPLIVIGIVIFLIFLVLSYYLQTIKSYIRMYFIGRFRGLWSKKALHTLLISEYKNSDEIKIKVTRGFGLFYENEGVFNHCIFKKQFNERKMVKVLLHYPCLKSIHLQKRALTNQKSIDEYVEDLFKVLKKFKDHSINPNADERIFVKFYVSHEEREWRFYIFKQKDEDKSLFFNHYEENTPGAKSRMLKVIGGHNSLCEEMNMDFDELFEDYSVELVENLHRSTKLINHDYCKHPACRQKIMEVHNKIFQS